MKLFCLVEAATLFYLLFRQKKTPPGVGTPSGDHWPKSGNGFPFDRTFTLFGAYGTTDRNYLGSFCS